MVNVMHSSMKSPGRTMALALALAPLGAAAARAQQSSAQPPARTHAHVVCVDGQCTEDSSRVIVVRLMDKVDSLQRIFLGRPITPEQRARMSEQMSDMIRQLTDLSAELSAKRAEAAEKLSEAVTKELAALAMPHARVAVAVTRQEEFGPHGVDEVELRLASHPGAPPLPLSQAIACCCMASLNRPPALKAASWLAAVPAPDS